jgi:threonyl-tRNA synthetase
MSEPIIQHLNSSFQSVTQYITMDVQADGGQGSGKTLPYRTKAGHHPGETANEAKVPLSSKSLQSKKTKAKDGSSSASGHSKAEPASASNKPQLDVIPDFVLQRNKLFDELKSQHDAEVLKRERPPIDVVLDLGLDKNGHPRAAMPVAAKAWESTPGSFLKHLEKDITSDVVVAKVDGKQLWDLDRPLEYDCRVSYIPFTSAEGRNVFWHSSAHALGEAAECHFQCLLSHGPPVEQGFFYDMAISDG